MEQSRNDEFSVVFYFNDANQRVAILRTKGVPSYTDEMHETLIGFHPSLKEKELYALYQGKEFLVWPDAYYNEAKDLGLF
ncbi:hypothetical protein EQG49_12665 [Periweissella cryptocerci]|uniref:Uncharacterized protein n=1 Tax=Periweissella cryptocerci TaxID=2506420 RepID=A0A4P6YWN1_9LACO|nr:hypothetical protein [Periweissella cryptocerci]QBO37250.1 hypothetical protein EQG49_12665 [Periweissella cryptocerci]